MDDNQSSKLADIRSQIGRDYHNSQEQRDRANEDMRFCNVDGGMWEGWLDRTHGKNSNRARMEFDMVSDPVYTFVGEWSRNRSQVTYEPDDDATSDDDADLRNRVYRASFSDNDGKISQDIAVLEAAFCGVGAFRYRAVFEDEEDPENEKQKIIWEPIFNAFNHVIWDSNAKRPDKMDARRAAVLTGYTREAFMEQYPDALPISAASPRDRREFTWNTQSQIYVAENYEVDIKNTRVEVFRNPETGEIDYFDPSDAELIKEDLAIDGWEYVRERPMKSRVVTKSILNGEEFLEEPTQIAGKFIPIIPVYAYRTYVDGAEHYRGFVRKRKDANRLLNSSISRMAESAATSGDRIPILTNTQVDGLENLWKDKTNKPFMRINDLEDAEGNPIAAGPVGYLEPPVVDPNSIAVTELATNYLDRLTASNEEKVDGDASSLAINAWRNWDSVKTQTVNENIDSSIVHSGRVWLSMAADVLKFRGVRAMSEDGTTTMEQLNRLTLDESGNKSQANDLSKGKFAVRVKAGAQYESQQEATVGTIQNVIQFLGDDSDYLDPAVATWVSNLNGTGLDPLKKLARRKMLLSGLADPETEEEEQMLAQVGQSKTPQDELTEAAAAQQRAEAENLQASSRNKDADTMKKKAETAATIVDIGVKRSQQVIDRLTASA